MTSKRPRVTVASALAFCFAVAFGTDWSAAAPAPDKPSRAERCKVVPGKPRPRSCAPWSGKEKPRFVEQRRKAQPSAVEAPTLKDPRVRARDRLERQNRRLLLRELSRLERLFRATPEDSPERARLLLRLAETFAELTRLAEIERLEAAERAREARSRSRDETRHTQPSKAPPSKTKPSPPAPERD